MTKGPVATAGSILIFSKSNGIPEPTKAATDIEETTASPTEIARGKKIGSVL